MIEVGRQPEKEAAADVLAAGVGLVEAGRSWTAAAGTKDEVQQLASCRANRQVKTCAALYRDCDGETETGNGAGCGCAAADMQDAAGETWDGGQNVVGEASHDVCTVQHCA